MTGLISCNYVIYLHAAAKVSTSCLIERDGFKYVGTENRTASGKTCQRWDSQAPHAHNWDVHRSNYRTLSDMGGHV